MQTIENAWRQFFKQFAPYVYVEGDIIADNDGGQINDPNNVLFPRITFTYSEGDFLTNSVAIYQIWDWSLSNERISEICDKLREAVPVESGTAIYISGETYFEYLNPNTEQWTKFDIADFNIIAQELAPDSVNWRRVEGETVGSIEIRRGSPFLTPSPKDEMNLRAMYGTLACRYLSIL